MKKLIALGLTLLMVMSVVVLPTAAEPAAETPWRPATPTGKAWSVVVEETFDGKTAADFPIAYGGADRASVGVVDGRLAVTEVLKDSQIQWTIIPDSAELDAVVSGEHIIEYDFEMLEAPSVGTNQHSPEGGIGYNWYDATSFNYFDFRVGGYLQMNTNGSGKWVDPVTNVTYTAPGCSNRLDGTEKNDTPYLNGTSQTIFPLMFPGEDKISTAKEKLMLNRKIHVTIHVLDGSAVAFYVNGNYVAGSNPDATAISPAKYEANLTRGGGINSAIILRTKDMKVAIDNVRVLKLGNINDVTVNTAENGTVVADKTTAVVEGETVTLTLNPANGYVVDTVKYNDGTDHEITAVGGVYSFTMPASAPTVTATFKKATYTVTVTDDGNGTGTATPVAGTMDTVIELTASPNAGYAFKEWQVISGDVTIADNKFTMGTKNVEVKAIFEAIPYTVTVSNDGNGTASANPATATIGTEVALTAAPKDGYQFKEWQVVSGGVTVDGDKFTMGTANVEIKAIFEAITYTVTVTDDGNGTATATPVEGVLGTEIVLTATPNPGYSFKEWKVLEGDVIIAENKFAMGTENVKVQAIFEAIPYTVTVTAEANGTASANVATATVGTEVLLTATPAEGYRLKEWKVLAGAVTVENGKFTMGTANVQIQAIFEEIPASSFSVTVNAAANGTVAADKTAALADEKVTLTLTPAAGYEIDTVVYNDGTADHAVTADADVYSFTMPSTNVTVTATFKKVNYTVTVTNDGNGTATATPVEGTMGTEIVLTATPNTGYIFKEWQVISGNVNIVDNKFTVGTENVEIKAIFEAVNYTVTVTNDGNGTATAAPVEGTINTEIVLTATPNAGYKFKEWQVISGGVTIVDNKFTVGSENVEVKAIFEARDDVAYTVNYYQMGLDGQYPTEPTSTATKNDGVTAQKATADTTAAEGFTFDAAKSTAEGTVLGDGSLVLSVYFSRNQYKLTFDANGVAGGSETNVYYGAAITAPTLTKTGYTYVWDKTVAATMPAADTTYTAVWTANTYTVRYNANGGGGIVASQTFTYDQAGTLNRNTFVRDGYAFVGWTTNLAQGTIEFYDMESVINLTAENNGVVDLYALWTTSISVMPTYYQVIAAPTTGGTVSLSRQSAPIGSTISLIVKAEDGFTAGTPVVTDMRGRTIVLTDLGNGAYSFRMPASNVKVNTAFTASYTNPYSDVAADAWYAKAVEYCTANGLMNGMETTKFAPDVALTRGMIVTVLYRLEGEPEATSSVSYFDVATDAYYAKAVDWATANKIVEGMGDGLYAPNAELTFEQLAAIMARYADFKGVKLEAGKTDGLNVSDWAKDEVALAIDLFFGVVTDISDMTKSAPRAVIAQVLYNYAQLAK